MRNRAGTRALAATLTPVSPPVLPETLVLRFRDRATDPGETIERHHDICAREGRVWWGWWHKAREHVPVAAFAHINERAKGDGLDIYLLNAHERRVHRARLLKIHWKDDLEPFTSPFPWFTPACVLPRPKACTAFCSSAVSDCASLVDNAPPVASDWSCVIIPSVRRSAGSCTTVNDCVAVGAG